MLHAVDNLSERLTSSGLPPGVAEDSVISKPTGPNVVNHFQHSASHLNQVPCAVNTQRVPHTATEPGKPGAPRQTGGVISRTQYYDGTKRGLFCQSLCSS